MIKIEGNIQMKNLKDKMKEKTLRVVGAHDALTAHMIQEHGFDGVWVSGFGLASVKGVPDANILTMTEVLEVTNSITNKVSNIPVIVDCDSGFGGIHNIARMVESFEKSGVSAVCIEDKPFPKVNSFAPIEQKLIPTGEFSKMIRVAKDSKKSKGFMVIARTEALIVGNTIEDALNRAYSYEKAGADAILIHSKSKTADQVYEFTDRWEGNIPLVIVPTTYSGISFKDIETTGKIKMVIYANQLLRKYVKSVDSILYDLKFADSTRYLDADISSVEEVFNIQGLDKMIDLEKEYDNDMIIFGR